jgi:hypothetical protein
VDTYISAHCSAVARCATAHQVSPDVADRFSSMMRADDAGGAPPGEFLNGPPSPAPLALPDDAARLADVVNEQNPLEKRLMALMESGYAPRTHEESMRWSLAWTNAAIQKSEKSVLTSIVTNSVRSSIDGTKTLLNTQA